MPPHTTRHWQHAGKHDSIDKTTSHHPPLETCRQTRLNRQKTTENSVYTKPSVVFHNANMLLYWAQLCWYDLSRCVHTYALHMYIHLCPLGLPYTTSQHSCVSLHEHQTSTDLDSLCNLNQLSGRVYIYITHTSLLSPSLSRQRP